MVRKLFPIPKTFPQFHEKEEGLRFGSSRDREERLLIKYFHLGGNEFLNEQMENYSPPLSMGPVGPHGSLATVHK